MGDGRGRHRMGRKRSGGGTALREPPPERELTPPTYWDDDREWRPRSDAGPRRTALERRRSRRRKRTALGTFGIVALAIVVVALAALGISKTVSGIGEDAGEESAAAAADPVTTMLVYGTKPDGGRDEVVWMTLLAYDAEQNAGSIVYIPAHAAAEVPGRGLLALADAYSGGAPLLVVTTEGLLGVDIDRHLELSEQTARVLFQSVGEVSVDVPVEVRVAARGDNARVLFAPGLQRLNEDFLVPLLFDMGIGGDDQELGSRHLAFWDALFERYADDPEGLERAFAAAGAAVAESDASVEDNAALLADLAALPDDARTVTNLPTSQVSVGETQLYEVDEEETEALMADIAATGAAPDGVASVQILNGVGAPGIGEEVAKRLVGEGFDVEVSGNAEHFDYRKTLLVVYDSDPETLALAERARELLGVGRVRVQVQQQDIVDLTVVIGKDFQESS